MAQTTPDELWSEDADTPWDRPVIGAAMQDSVQDALNRAKGLLVGTTAQRDSLDSPVLRAGLYFSNTSTGILERYDGSVWQPVIQRRTTFTPLWTNILFGSGSTSGWYQVVGGICSGEITATLGTGWAMNTNPVRVALPVAPSVASNGIPAGNSVYVDSGSGFYAGAVLTNLDGTVTLKHLSNGGYGFYGDVRNSNEPFAWASGDIININFSYAL